MSEEEIRIECLKLAASIIGEIDSNNQLFDVADELYNYVIQYEPRERNKIEFEKTLESRKE